MDAVPRHDPAGKMGQIAEGGTLACSNHVRRQRVFRMDKRTTRSMSLTEDGKVFYDHVLSALDGVIQADGAVRPGGAAVRGHLRVVMPLAFGRMHVVPRLTALLDQSPDRRLTSPLPTRRLILWKTGSTSPFALERSRIRPASSESLAWPGRSLASARPTSRGAGARTPAGSAPP